ncbi:hypothetical protein DdX_03170 [Ditylenchus destructor]|uniref:Uncharacterized protein n=1 Tax=Ditylenchus destructor TaxID=166010 RepID=A0AAD4R9S1_9BILA|nr:hypothetical protein DdX_03170 [Ditylenchus destructor]
MYIKNETKEHDDINPNSTCFSNGHVNDTNSITSLEESACTSSLSTNDDPLVFHEKILNLDCSVLAAIENTRAKEWRNPAKRRPQSKIPTLMVRSLNDKFPSNAKRNDRHSVPLTTMSTSMNVPESASITFPTQAFEDQSSCGSSEQMALDGFRSPLQESRACLSRIHQKPSSRPRTYYSPRALTQPLSSGEHSYPPSRKLSSQCLHSSNDFICQSSNGVGPIRECDKYKNSFGGWIVPIEKKVRLYKNPLSKCWLCRFDSAVLRRIKRRLTLRAENLTKKLRASNKLCRRDPCRCSVIYNNLKSKYVSNNAGNESGILSTLFPMDYAVILAVISLIFHLVDLVLFTNNHKEFCS